MFETESAKYAYDVNSRRIIRVNDLRWALLSDWQAGDADIARRVGGGVTPEEVQAARKEIEELGESGEVFSSNHPSAIRTLFRREDIEMDLSRNCHQMILSVTEQCNLRCAYCYYGSNRPGERQHSPRMMTWETAKRALDFFLPRSKWTLARWQNRTNAPTLPNGDEVEPPCVGFYGGEPLVNWPLVKRVTEYVRALPDGDDYMVNFTTNGTLLTPEISAFLCENRVSILVSLDGPKEIHDRYRRFAGGGGTWDVAVRNLRYILDNMPDYYRSHVGLTGVLAPPLDLRVIVDFFTKWDLNCGMSIRLNGLDKDVPACFWEPIDRADRRVSGQDELWQEFLDVLFAGKMKDDYVPHSKEEMRRLRALRHLHDRRLDKIYGRAKHLVRGKALLEKTFYTNFGMCPPGRARLFVQIDGRLCPCERVPSQAEAFIIGDIEKGFDMDAIMRLCEGNAELLEDQCVDCWNLTMCSTRCKGLIGEDGRLSREAKLTLCEANKSVNHITLVDMCRILERDPDALRYLDKIY